MILQTTISLLSVFVTIRDITIVWGPFNGYYDTVDSVVISELTDLNFDLTHEEPS